MSYALEQGPSEKNIVAQCLKQGLPLPKAIADAPELALGLEFVYHAFWELSSCRSVGFGVGSIPWAAMAEYARFHELAEDDFENFSFLIRAMDKKFLEFHAPKAPVKPPKNHKNRPAE